MLERFPFDVNRKHTAGVVGSSAVHVAPWCLAFGQTPPSPFLFPGQSSAAALRRAGIAGARLERDG